MAKFFAGIFGGLFKAMSELPLSVTIRESVWIFAIDQAFHLVALAVFAGAVLLVDLRMLGAGFNKRPLSQVARDAQPWLIGSFIALVATGIPQLMSNAIKELYSVYFWWKMCGLVVAFLFTVTVRRSVAFGDDSPAAAGRAKLVGLASITLWGFVAMMGRLIGLLS